MMDEPDLQGVERELRAVGAPPTPPPALATAARAAALRETPEVVDIRRRQPLFDRLRRPMLAAAVIAACVIGALVIGVNGRGGIDTVRTVSMTGSGGAEGTIKFASAQGPSRQVALRVNDLPPAPEGHYYELWMADGSARIGLVAFNTGDNGRAQATTALPSDVGWDRCWVTEESWTGQHGTATTVLDSQT
jgi:anti-sigma-K factor RskA